VKKTGHELMTNFLLCPFAQLRLCGKKIIAYFVFGELLLSQLNNHIGKTRKRMNIQVKQKHCATISIPINWGLRTENLSFTSSCV